MAAMLSLSLSLSLPLRPPPWPCNLAIVPRGLVVVPLERTGHNKEREGNLIY